MNPALLINDLRNGGAERLVTNLAVEMHEHEDIIPLIIVANPSGELLPKVDESAVEVVSLDTSVSTTSIPRAVWKLSSELRKRGIDLVHSHLPFSHVVGRLSCLGCRVPHVSTYHNVRSHKTVPRRLAERTTRRLSDQIICVSEEVQKSYPDSERTTVIYNAIDVNGFFERVTSADTSNLEAQSDEQMVFLNVARCVEQKRQEDLIKAVALLETDDIHLYIVGDGPQRARLERLVLEKSLSDQVTVTGYVEEIEPYFSIADAFVSSSANEGLPTTHIEAMAAKMPVLSTDIPEVREVVSHGKNGYLCEVGRYDCIAEMMQLLSGDSNASFGSRGFEAVKTDFSLSNIASNHINLYDKILNEGYERT